MSKKMNKLVAMKRKAGQNTAEYLIMLVLISVGSIGVFSVFGGTLRNQVSSAVAAFSGDKTSYDSAQSRAKSGGKMAEPMAAKNLNMSGISGDDVTGFDVEKAKSE